MLLFRSQHIQIAIPKLLRFHLRGNLLLPFVVYVINGPYYFQRDPLAAVPKEQVEIWLYRSLSWTHLFTFDIYTGCGFLCNSLESSLNLKKVLVFLEASGQGKSFIELKCFELKPVLVWLEMFQRADLVIFLSSASGIYLEISLTKRIFFSLEELRTKGNDSSV